MGDTVDFREIEGLLEKTNTDPDDQDEEEDEEEEEEEEEEQKSFKKYVKLILPHVALVVVVGIYAVIGALVFYRVESPHEDKVKSAGVQKILGMRNKLVESMWNYSGKGFAPKTKLDWMKDSETRIEEFTAFLYAAFKKEFVRYHDVPPADISASEKFETQEKEKLWTTPSSIFFAATTMATIGRIICVFFALLGAPLAIITIGDLGKFLSECTIWLYKKLKAGRAAATSRWQRFRHPSRSGSSTLGGENGEEKESPARSEGSVDLEDLIMDKTEVPVLLVFAILLIYIAFGAVLFAFLEGWSYVDSFYFCFITLTTVGFGDLVPEKHQYIILMLLYIGVGLAVTTMCIDLVGIQYIQKIHYFGRKFRGTDLLQLLRRRRMMERHLAMTGQRDGGMIQVFLEKNYDIPSPPVEEWKETLSWEVDNIFTYEVDSVKKEKTPSPVPTPSPIATSPSVYERDLMFKRQINRLSSWTPSGPAEAAKSQRKVKSCPAKFLPSPPPSPVGMHSMEDWESYQQMYEESKKPWLKPPEVTVEIPSPQADSDDELGPPSLLSALSTPISSPGESELDFGAFEVISDSGVSAGDLVTSGEPLIYHESIPVHSVHHQTVKTESVVESLMNCPDTVLSKEKPPVVVSDNYCFIVDGDVVKMADIMGDDQWWRHTSRPTKYYFSENMKQFTKVNIIQAKGKIIAARFPSTKKTLSPGTHLVSFGTSPRSSISGPSPASSSNSSGIEISFHHSPLPHHITKEQVDLPLENCYKVVRFYSFWKTCTAFHRIVTLIAPADDEKRTPGFKKRIFIQYLWRNAKDGDRKRVAREFDPHRQKLMKYMSNPMGVKRKVFQTKT